ncbi:MAG: VWA domain-containing protein, partial [Leisingera sp.]
MPDTPPLTLPDHPKLVRNLTHFARALRKAGLPIGPGRVLDAVEAVAAACLPSRGGLFWAPHACFLTKPEPRPVFAPVFRLFWPAPRYLDHLLA